MKPETLITSGPAARTCGVSTTALKKWEESGRLRPVVVLASGVRLYDPNDVERVARERGASNK